MYASPKTLAKYDVVELRIGPAAPSHCVMFQQKFDESPHARRYCRATYEHRINRFLFLGFQASSRGSSAAQQILGDAELADTRHAGTHPATGTV
jgi:hypothetical protein